MIVWPNLRPAAIPGATWQSGVTRGHARLRVFLNGEPVPAALACSTGTDGWVQITRPVRTPGSSRRWDTAEHYQFRSRIVTKRGRVELKPDQVN